MKANLTASVIQRMSYLNLQKLAIKKGIEFTGQSKQKLIDLLLTKLSSLENEIPEAETVEQEEVINGNTLPEKLVPKLKNARNAKKVIQIKTTPVKKTENAKKARENKKETKSSKILAMYLKGCKVSEISEALSAHPSFCYTVVGKYKAKNK